MFSHYVCSDVAYRQCTSLQLLLEVGVAEVDVDDAVDPPAGLRENELIQTAYSDVQVG